MCMTPTRRTRFDFFFFFLFILSEILLTLGARNEAFKNFVTRDRDLRGRGMTSCAARVSRVGE